MSLLNRIRGAFGWKAPLEVRAVLPPLTVASAGRDHLAGLPTGFGIHVSTTPGHRGRVVVVTEGELQGPPPPPLLGLPVTIGDADLTRLAGRTLDYADGRWMVRVDLDLRAQDTPNPDSRLYLCDHVLAVGRPSFFTRERDDADPPELAARLLEGEGVRTVLLRENTATVEREPSVPWPTVDAAVDAAIREHLLSCGGPVEASEVHTSGDPLFEQIRAAIAEHVLPAIHRDGGDMDLLDVTDGVVRVSLVGACRTCPSSTATLRHGIEHTLKRLFPEQIVRVEQV